MKLIKCKQLYSFTKVILVHITPRVVVSVVTHIPLSLATTTTMVCHTVSHVTHTDCEEVQTLLVHTIINSVYLYNNKMEGVQELGYKMLEYSVAVI